MMIRQLKMTVRAGASLLFAFILLLGFHSASSLAQIENAELATPSASPKFPELGVADFPLVENGWYSLPPWAKSLPFDLKSRFDLPIEDNREQLYCQFIAALRPGYGANTFAKLRLLDSSVIAKLSEDVNAKLGLVMDFDFERTDQKGQFQPLRLEKDLKRAQELLTPFRAEIEKLKLAGQRPHCFFHSEWLPSSISVVHDVSDALCLIVLECNTELSQPEALQCVELGLLFKRDLSSLGSQIEQVVTYHMERTVFGDMVMPFWDRPNLTVPEIDRLIDLLRKHDAECAKNDLCMEVAKREMLELLHVMHLLHTGTFDTTERRGRLDVEPEEALLTLLFREVVDYGCYRVNASYVREEVQKLAQTNEAISNAWEEIQGNWDDEDFAAKGARILLGFFLSDELDANRAGGYQRDIAVLNSRYRQIEEACQLPYPDSTRQLERLEESWTVDNSWKQTRFLRWFLPDDMSAKLRRRGQLWRNAHLSLAAIRRWQLQHGGQDPPSLKAAFDAIGMKIVPVDPFSGKPLRFFSDYNSIGTYSVGPDEKDDGGKVTVEPVSLTPTSESPKGDILFVMQRQ